MQKKYISTSRYKKVSSESRKKRSENISKKLRNSNKLNVTNHDINNEEVFEKKIKRRKRSGKKRSKLILPLSICIVILVLCVLRLTFKGENESFFDILGVKIEKKIEKIDIAVVDNIDVLDDNTKNVILTELNSYTNGVLVKITDKYEIQYELLEDIQKENNSTYILKISSNNSLTSSILKSSINTYMDESSKYYEKCKNIQSVEEIDTKTLKITLKTEDPLFAYNLQLPINYSTTNTGIYSINATRGVSNKVSYIKKEYVNDTVPQSLTLTSVKDDDEAVEMLQNETIDMFFTDSYDIAEKLGRKDIDIRSYLNGKCIFLFGNKNSKNFSKKEIRQVIAYSIDREKIRKEVYLNSGSVIDIPEIYSEVKYKYDIYAAENILLSSGYNMQDSKFFKNGEKLELTMLVNKADETKIKVATYIKEDLEEIGISVNIKSLSSADIEKEINNNNYDLVLADVTINENPDISFIKKYITVSDVISDKITEIEKTQNIQETVKKVNELIQCMSDEIACIGIHADATYLVSNKELNMFSDIKYMNIFKDMLTTKNM